MLFFDSRGQLCLVTQFLLVVASMYSIHLCCAMMFFNFRISFLFVSHYCCCCCFCHCTYEDIVFLLFFLIVDMLWCNEPLSIGNYNEILKISYDEFDFIE